MRKILITGATGNIGLEVIRHMNGQSQEILVTAGVRNVENWNNEFASFSEIQPVTFDFEDPATFASALDGVDCVFLLRPPHISNVKKVFHPLIETLEKMRVKQVVFLSVQGVEKSAMIPHHKIEKRILQGSLDYIFLRPAYFMQNLTTTLLDDVRVRDTIMLPAGKGIFNWIDAQDIGAVAAEVIRRFDTHKNTAIDITGSENMSFDEVAQKMSHIIGRPIVFDNANVVRFYRTRKRQGMKSAMILVMIMLHFLPQFQKPPRISNACEAITGKKPTTLELFLKRERSLFTRKNADSEN